MPSIFRNTSYHDEAGTYVLTPVDAVGNKLNTITSTYTTKEYKADLPPGSYVISLTVNASLTGTTTTLGGFKAYADPLQTRNCTSPFNGVLPTAAAVSASVTFPAAGIGKFIQLVPTSASATAASGSITLPHGLRILVTRGTAAAGEKFEVVVAATKLR